MFMPRSIASSKIFRHAAGSLPPLGAMPISSVLASGASASLATTGIAPPTPSSSCDVLPGCVVSNSATTSSGL